MSFSMRQPEGSMSWWGESSSRTTKMVDVAAQERVAELVFAEAAGGVSGRGVGVDAEGMDDELFAAGLVEADDEAKVVDDRLSELDLTLRDEKELSNFSVHAGDGGGDHVAIDGDFGITGVEDFGPGEEDVGGLLNNGRRVGFGWEV
jgi:hypothetical protein